MGWPGNLFPNTQRGPFMNWLVYHVVSGQAFFTGCILLIVAAVTSMQSRAVLKRITVLSFLIGVIAVVVSSTAIPYWHYGIAAAVTLASFVSRFRPNWRRRVAYAVAAVWLGAALFELPYYLTPSLHPTKSRMVTVIGDSVTAGVDGDEKSETWPSILAREHRLQVQDISHIGETAASALKRVKAHSIKSSVVVVELGGNDVLGSTRAPQFRADLDALLAELVSPGRQIVMFELPLPPFCHEYGRMQRSIAARHNVLLIPKRVFLSVISGNESTLDTIHLSQSGHQLMSDCVWNILSSGISDEGGHNDH